MILDLDRTFRYADCRMFGRYFPALVCGYKIYKQTNK